MTASNASAPTPGWRTSRVIRQPIPGRPLQKIFCGGLRMPRRWVHPAIRAAKIAGNPAQYRLRRRLAEEIQAGLDRGVAIPDDAGHRFFGPDEIPGGAEVVARCGEIYDEVRVGRDAEIRQLNPKKSFLLSILAGNDFLAYPELLRFMISRPVLDPVTAYLGSVPILAGANLLWSPPNESERSSQLFHIDDEEMTQIKIFLNVKPVGDDEGPFTFLPAEISERVQDTLHYDGGRLSDEVTHAAGGEGRALQLVGPAGRGLFVDTSRCLHYGSRSNRHDRLVLLIQFWRFHSPSESKARLQVPPSGPEIASDEVQALALGLH